MFDALFTFIYSELGFHEIIEEDTYEYLIGIDFATGEDFSGRI